MEARSGAVGGLHPTPHINSLRLKTMSLLSLYFLKVSKMTLALLLYRVVVNIRNMKSCFKIKKHVPGSVVLQLPSPPPAPSPLHSCCLWNGGSPSPWASIPDPSLQPHLSLLTFLTPT